ncbi:unnamed protein product [Cuscuta campestris]|uniref:SBP-type domain-containing protein n=1 Tax=Cuscuta campestris TaxID=132261 RepID=A0A484K7J8_9ASTE|nr:unnamed protein product [Cuscuta campestris]
MELGSSSFSSSSSSSTAAAAADSSLNIGLKIGQETYFGDAGKSGNGSAAASSLPAKKGRSGGAVAQGGQPARCQVEGCNQDLSDAKAYYSRHKVCAMHSKSPTVTVAGIEQRFCQQCSRFHQLPEFDQGKRSCRRRLAGHNERRRKPPPGTLFSPRFAGVPSHLFDNSSSKGGGGYLMDFSSYQNPTGRESWPDPRSFGQPWDGRTTTAPPPGGRFLETQPELLLHGSTYHGGGPNNVPSGECLGGGFPSVVQPAANRALSLLSNHHHHHSWGGSRNPPPLGLEVNHHSFVGAPDGTPAVHPSSEYSNAPWGFKVAGSTTPSSSNEMLPDLGLGNHTHYPDEIGMNAHHQENENGREFVGLEEHSRGYDSSLQNVHWSL